MWLKKISIAVIVLTLSVINAQSWMDAAKEKAALENKALNYYDIVEAFEEYRAGRPYQRGLGFKQFYRWQEFWRHRINSDGTFPNLVEQIDLNATLNKPQSVLRAGTWTTLGPDNATYTTSWSPGHGRINGIEVDPNDNNTIYIGAPSGGVWKTTDGGSTWAPLGDNLAFIGVSSIEVDPNNSNVVYLGTGDADGYDTYSIGVLKSTDGGATWNEVLAAPSALSVISKVAIDPNNSNHVFAATSGGFYRSTDAGVSWTKTNNASLGDFEFKPNDSDVIYGVSTNKTFKSSDNGVTWTQLNTGVPTLTGRQRIEVSAAAPDEIWVLSCTSSYEFDRIVHSTDNGSTWNNLGIVDDIFDGATQAWYDLAFAVSPVDEDIMFVGVLNVWKTSDGGATWSGINSWSNPLGAAYTHADIHYMRYMNGTLYAGTDGGIYASNNDGGSFSDLTRGLNIGQFYKIDVIPGRPEIAGGLQDNGGYFYNGNEWRVYYGADGMDNAIAPNDPTHAYGMIQFGGLYSTTDDGMSVNNLGEPEEGLWVTPMMFDPADDNFIITGYSKMYEYNIFTASFSELGPQSFSGKVSSFDISPIDHNFLVVSNGSEIWISNDRGTTYNSIGTPSGNTINAVTCSPFSTDEIYVCIGGTNNNDKVYFTADAGVTWTNLSNGLPNLSINDIVVQNGTNNMVYVGTDVGVYYKDHSMPSFEAFNDGLPNVIVLDLELDETNNTIYAGTYGRGVWQSPTQVTSTSNPIPAFSSNKRSICPGESITYYNESLQSTSVLWNFTGGDINSSTLDTVTVTYNTSGNYDVQITASAGANSEVLNSTDYAQILGADQTISMPITEGFQILNDFNAKWSVNNVGNDNGFTIANVGFNSNKSLYLANRNEPLEGIDELISYPIDFSNTTVASVRFKTSYARRAFHNTDSLKLYLQEVCNPGVRYYIGGYGREDLEMEWEIGIWQPSSDADWKTFHPDIPSAYFNGANGTSFQLVFQFKAGGGNHFYIDDINIDKTVGVEETKLTQFSLAPNPTKDITLLTVDPSEKIYQVDIFDVAGKKVKSLAFSPNAKCSIDLSDLNKGIYLFEAKTISGSKLSGKIEKQ